MSQVPTRLLEKSLLATYPLVAGMDEVGRGALAGPATVGVALVDNSTSDAFPSGLKDSKLLSPTRRQNLVEPVKQWVVDSQVAHASPSEVDRFGIVGALRLAGFRALAQLAKRGHHPDVIILDGRDNWLSSADLFLSLADAEMADLMAISGELAPVTMQVKADANCAVVAAASVLAKVERDSLMAALPDPGYGWASNKGYAAPAHREAIATLGASEHHRRSWHLPGLDQYRQRLATGDIEAYENEQQLELYHEYRDVVGLFNFVVETERRFYLANYADVQMHQSAAGDIYFEVIMDDVWVWDIYRPSRFVKRVRVVTFKDVNVEELNKPEIEMPPSQV